MRRIIAAHVGVPEEWVVLGAGATGVVIQVLHATTVPGDRMVMATPTFDARVVVLCRPHNPSGTLESAVEVERFLRRVPDDTVVLLDEAYVEFVSAADRIDESSLVRRFPNVVVVRTFSKAYGLAGLRIGYGFGAPDLARKLWSMQPPFGMGITGLVGVAASYRAEQQLWGRVRTINEERRYLQRRLRAARIYSTDAQANFVYLPADGRPWREVLDSKGSAHPPRVRHYPDGSVRITVGGRQSTRAVLAALAHR